MRGRFARWALWALCGLAGNVHAERPEIVIDPGGVAPQALRVINEAVGVIARQAEDQDGGEADRLRRRARDATLAALTTQGYFSAQVTLHAGTDVGGATWDIAIVPGKRSVIGAVDLVFDGRIGRPEYAERLRALRAQWLLPQGKPFINADWNKAKSELLNDAASKDFLLARITASQAEVDTASAQVRLSVTMDSGPLVKIGPLSTTGLKRVPDSLVGRYIRYREGENYDEEKLETWQQNLQSTEFFRGAFVTLERPGEAVGQAAQDSAPAAAAGAGSAFAVDSDGEVTLPLNVRVVEAPAKRLSGSIGFDSDAGVRLETLYRQNVVFGQPVTLETGAGADRLRQRAFADIYLPPDGKGNKDSVGVLADHSDIQGLDVTRYALGATRLRERRAGDGGRVEYENRWGLLAAHDHVKIDGSDEYDLPSVMATSEWLRRDVDSKFNPREGNLIALGGGVGVTLNDGQPFTRVRLRGQKWWPVAERDVLTVRGEVGRVWSGSDTRVPDDFGFRTGGARSIRGYRYLSIGVDRGDAVVGASALAVASIEYDHYFDERYGMGVFLDAGDAAESFSDMRVALGYGVGARVRTPAGPLFMDVAYGQRDRSLRLSFSLGIAF